MANNTMNFGVDLLPTTTNTFSLGSSEKKWIINGVSNPKLSDTTYTAGNGLNLSGTTFKNERGIEYIRGTWTAASGTWTGTTKDDELYDGKQIILYMPFGGSGNATLNLTLSGGGTTGEKNVYYESTTRFTTHKGQNSQLHLIYHKAQILSDGKTYEGWWYVANRDTTNIYALGNNYNYYKAKAAIYRYQILLTVDEQYLLPVNSVNNSTETNKTLTTEEFDLFGEVFYWASTTTVNANANLPNWVNLAIHYNGALIDLRYSFNTGTTLTERKAVYLVCEPQTNGKVKLSSNPISQNLPTSEDGKIYKYLGQAYDNYRITLHVNKPNYVFRNGAIQEYTRDADSWTNDRKVYTNLGNASTTTTINGGTANAAAIGIGVNGTLGAGNGGTGQTNLTDAANALINALGTGSSNLTSNDYVITQYVGGGTTTTTYHRRPASAVINATLVKAALGTDSSTITKWLNQKGEWSTPTPSNVGLGNVSNNSNLNNVTGAQGDIIYWSAANTPTHLSNTSSTTKQALTITSQVPAWVNISPSISITAGDASNAPKINVNVLGVSGTAQAITTASTSVYGVTKLNDGIDSSSTTLAATANSALIAAKKVASSNNTSKLYLVGATSQSATSVDSYSYQYTYTNNGLLSALKVGLNLNGTEKAHLEWNNTDQSIDFIFE